MNVCYSQPRGCEASSCAVVLAASQMHAMSCLDEGVLRRHFQRAIHANRAVAGETRSWRYPHKGGEGQLLSVRWSC